MDISNFLTLAPSPDNKEAKENENLLSNYSSSVKDYSNYSSTAIPVQDFSKYDEGMFITPNTTISDINKRRASKQGIWDEFGNFFNQAVVGQVIGGTIQATGGLLELPKTLGIGIGNLLGITKKQADFSNALTDWGQDIINWSEKVTPIYRDNPEQNFDFKDSAYWFSMLPSVVSTVSLMLPGMGVSKGLSTVSKFMRTLSEIKNLEKISKLEKLGKNTAKVIADATNMDNYWLNLATINGASTIGENYMETAQVGKDTKDYIMNMPDAQFDKFINSEEGIKVKEGIFGRSQTDIEGRPVNNIVTKDQVADYVASKAMWKNFGLNTPGFLFTLPEFATLIKAKKLLTTNSLGLISKKVAKAQVASKLGSTATEELIDAGVKELRPLGKKILYNLKTPSQFVLENLGEGAQEMTQAIAQSDAMHYGKYLLGEEPASDFGDRLSDYLHDSSTWEQGFWGALGGIAFSGASRSINRLKNAINDTEDDHASIAKLHEIEGRERTIATYGASLAAINNNKNIFAVTKNEDGTTTTPDFVGTPEEIEEQKATALEAITTPLYADLGLKFARAGNVDFGMDWIDSKGFRESMVNSGIAENEEEVTSKIPEIKKEIMSSVDAYKDAYSRIFSKTMENEQVREILLGKVINNKNQIDYRVKQNAKLQSEINKLKNEDNYLTVLSDNEVVTNPDGTTQKKDVTGSLNNFVLEQVIKVLDNHIKSVADPTTNDFYNTQKTKIESQINSFKKDIPKELQIDVSKSGINPKIIQKQVELEINKLVIGEKATKNNEVFKNTKEVFKKEKTGLDTRAEIEVGRQIKEYLNYLNSTHPISANSTSVEYAETIQNLNDEIRKVNKGDASFFEPDPSYKVIYPNSKPKMLEVLKNRINQAKNLQNLAKNKEITVEKINEVNNKVRELAKPAIPTTYDISYKPIEISENPSSQQINKQLANEIRTGIATAFANNPTSKDYNPLISKEKAIHTVLSDLDNAIAEWQKDDPNSDYSAIKQFAVNAVLEKYGYVSPKVVTSKQSKSTSRNDIVDAALKFEQNTTSLSGVNKSTETVHKITESNEEKTTSLSGVNKSTETVHKKTKVEKTEELIAKRQEIQANKRDIERRRDAELASNFGTDAGWIALQVYNPSANSSVKSRVEEYKKIKEKYDIERKQQDEELAKLNKIQEAIVVDPNQYTPKDLTHAVDFINVTIDDYEKSTNRKITKVVSFKTLVAHIAKSISEEDADRVFPLFKKAYKLFLIQNKGKYKVTSLKEVDKLTLQDIYDKYGKPELLTPTVPTFEESSIINTTGGSNVVNLYIPTLDTTLQTKTAEGDLEISSETAEELKTLLNKVKPGSKVTIRINTKLTGSKGYIANKENKKTVPIEIIAEDGTLVGALGTLPAIHEDIEYQFEGEDWFDFLNDDYNLDRLKDLFPVLLDWYRLHSKQSFTSKEEEDALEKILIADSTNLLNELINRHNEGNKITYTGRNGSLNHILNVIFFGENVQFNPNLEFNKEKIKNNLTNWKDKLTRDNFNIIAIRNKIGTDPNISITSEVAYKSGGSIINSTDKYGNKIYRNLLDTIEDSIDKIKLFGIDPLSGGTKLINLEDSSDTMSFSKTLGNAYTFSLFTPVKSATFDKDGRPIYIPTTIETNDLGHTKKENKEFSKKVVDYIYDKIDELIVLQREDTPANHEKIDAIVEQLNELTEITYKGEGRKSNLLSVNRDNVSFDYIKNGVNHKVIYWFNKKTNNLVIDAERIGNVEKELKNALSYLKHNVVYKNFKFANYTDVFGKTYSSYKDYLISTDTIITSVGKMVDENGNKIGNITSKTANNVTGQPLIINIDTSNLHLSNTKNKESKEEPNKENQEPKSEFRTFVETQHLSPVYEPVFKIFDELLNMGYGFNPNFSEDETNSNLVGGFGAYIPDTEQYRKLGLAKTIVLTKKWSELSVEEKTKILAHEIIHAHIKEQYKDNYKELINKLDTFYTSLLETKEVKENTNSTIGDIIKIIGNEREELITYALTNKTFATFLDSIKSDNVAESTSFWKQLKDIIRDIFKPLFGTKLDELNTILDSILPTGEKTNSENNSISSTGDEFDDIQLSTISDFVPTAQTIALEKRFGYRNQLGKYKPFDNQDSRVIAINRFNNWAESKNISLSAGTIHFYIKETGVEHDGIKIVYKERPIIDNSANTQTKLQFANISEANEITYKLKSVSVLLSDRGKQIFEKGEKNKWSLDKILTELAIPKEQKKLLLDLGVKDRDQLILELTGKYGFSIEINTAKKIYREASQNFFRDPETGEEFGQTEDYGGTGYYSNLTVPGGTNYTENEISTPLITPSIKGHAQFSTDKGIGWFRSDEQVSKEWNKTPNISSKILEDSGYFYVEYGDANMGQIYERFDSKEDAQQFIDNKPNNTFKTRRILEIQSDLFQKGRDKEDLIKTLEVEDKKNNITDIFNKFPNLKEIGTEEQYSMYLDTIFPNSIIKDILMHGTIFDIKEFKSSALGKNTRAASAYKGFFFTDNKEVAKSYIKSDRISEQKWLSERNKQLIENRGELNIENINNHISILLDLLSNSNSIGFPNKKVYYNDSSYIYSIKDTISLPIEDENFNIIDFEKFKIDRYFKHSYNLNTNKYEDIEITEEEAKSKLDRYSYSSNSDSNVINFYLNKLYAVKQLLEDGVSLPNLPIGLKRFINPIKYHNVYEESESIINYITDKYAQEKIISFEKPNPNIVYTILNIQNPISFDYEGNKYREVKYDTLLKQGIKLNNDGAVFKNTYDSGFLKNDEYLANVYVTFDNSNIHILGSSTDEDMFKNYINLLQNKNQFLQLLNKDNNWVTFFIKSIIQDSIKKGYEQILFPTGETAAKIEGHETIADEIKLLDSAIEKVNNNQYAVDDGSHSIGIGNGEGFVASSKEDLLKQLNNKKQEFKSQGLEKLKPIEAFYEHQVTNILNKLGTVTKVKDEYDNEWNKITLSDDKIQQSVFPIQLASIVDELPFKGNLELIDDISDNEVLDRINQCK